MFPSRGGCPAHHVQRELAEKAALILYASHLSTYARAFDLSRDCLLLYAIEGHMIEAIEKGIEKDYGLDVVFACGVAFGQSCNTAMIMGIQDQAQLAFLQAKNKIICQTAEFVSKHFASGIWHTARPRRTKDDYEQILYDLWDRWMSLPFVNRLKVPA